MQVAVPSPRPARKLISKKKALLLFFFSVLAVAAYLFTRPPHLELTFEMSSSARATAQLLLDLGHGYNSTDYDLFQVTSSSLNSFEEVRFYLPVKTVSPGRLVLLPPPHRFKIRNMAIRNSGLALLRIPPEDMLPLLDTVTRSQDGSEASFTTSPSATFAHLEFKSTARLHLKRRILFQNLRLLLVATCLLCIPLILLLWLPAILFSFARAPGALLNRLHSSFGRIARRLSIQEFIHFDSYAIWFYAICLTLFIASSLADLNGSSIAAFSAQNGYGVAHKVWLGAPRPTRADEWGYSTPDILNQSLRADRFAVGNSALGGHSVALLGNIPVRHFTTIFRPQYWAFFLLPPDYAFAVYWQCKALILLTGLFTWLLLITRSTFWSVTGSLWYFFSPFTQWAYSWPTGLPEMVGLVCFTMVLTCYLTVGRNMLALFLSSLGLVACVINFALCAYVPHMIPLVWLAVFFCMGWCIARRSVIVTRQNAGPRLLALSLAFVLIALVGSVVFVQLRPALIAIANTAYPGRRFYAAPNTSPFLFLSHFMQWTETEQHLPPVLGNLSEASGFLWIAPATLLCFRRMTLSSMQKFALASLWLVSLMLLAWLLLPVPPIIGAIFALNKTAGPRPFLALGLANVAIVSITAASMRRLKPSPDRKRAVSYQRKRVSTTLAWASLAVLAWALMFHLLQATNQRLGFFFNTSVLVLSALFAVALVALLISGRKLALALALVIPQAVLFGTVNPVERGLTTITASPLYKFVRQNPSLLQGKWIVFSPGVVASGFVAATGCDVYTGMHYIPDIDHFPLFAADGIDPQTLNALGYLEARVPGAGENAKVELHLPVLLWRVNPGDPILPRLGIKYFAFDQRPSPAVVSKLLPLSPQPIDSFWLYRSP